MNDSINPEQLKATVPDNGFTGTVEPQNRLYQIGQLLDDLRDTHVETQRDKEFDWQLRRLFKVAADGSYTHHPVRFTRGTETRAIVAIDAAGSGKTTSILKGLQEFEALANNPETGQPRWVAAKVESPSTLRSIACSILRKTGFVTLSERTKVYDLWALVRHRLMVQGISLLWLDEAHDLFRSESKEVESTLEMLKSLMQGDHPVVLVLSGTEKLAELTQIVDRQGPRRFNNIMPMPLQIGVDNDRIADLVGAYATHCGLKVRLKSDTISRLIRGSRNRFGTCIDLIINAIEIALHQSADSLAVEHFEIAWGQLDGCELSQNVFAVNDWTTLEFPEEQADQNNGAPGQRPRAGRKRKG